MKGNEKWLETVTLAQLLQNPDVSIEVLQNPQTGGQLRLVFCMPSYARYQVSGAQFVSAIRAMEGRTPSGFWEMESHTLSTYGQVRILTLSFKAWQKPTQSSDSGLVQLRLPGF